MGAINHPLTYHGRFIIIGLPTISHIQMTRLRTNGYKWNVHYWISLAKEMQNQPQSPATMELISQTIMSVELVQYHVQRKTI